MPEITKNNGEGIKIKISLMHSIMALLAMLLAVGVAWGTQAARVTRNEKDIMDLKQDIKQELTEINNQLNDETFGLKVLNYKVETLSNRINK